jgi:hypothetical protein
MPSQPLILNFPIPVEEPYPLLHLHHHHYLGRL